VAVEWRPAALQDVRDLLGYLLEYSVIAAADAERQINEKVALIAGRPLIGRQSRYPGLREFSMPDYAKVFIYAHTDEGITIVRMLDRRAKRPKSV